MIHRILAAGALTIALAMFGATPAHATETRQFRGEGSSSLGLAYWYAFGDAAHQADVAGFDDCDIVDHYTRSDGGYAWVLLSCTR